MWKNYDLPSSVVIESKTLYMDTDWRNIIDIFECFNDDSLTVAERMDCGLDMLFINYDEIPDWQKAVEYMLAFISGNKQEETTNGKRSGADIALVDWQKDMPLIIPPVNKALGYEIKEKEHLHWWTFLGAFYEIGECTFQTYVGIRYKLAKHKPLEKWEKEIYMQHKAEIDIKKKAPQYDNFDDEDILMKLAKEKNSLLIE